MSLRTEALKQLYETRDAGGDILLSRKLQSAAEKKLESATRTYEDARKDALTYDLASYGLAVFGSARIKPSSRLGKSTTEFVQGIIEDNPSIPLVVITGGGPGIMEAANRGAHKALEKNRHIEAPLSVVSYGVTIELPRQEQKNKYVGVENRHPEFSTRKQKMLDMASGILIMTGGYGTLYETLMAIQNKQTGHIEKDFLIVAHSFWEPIFDLINDELYHNFYNRGRRPMINEADLNVVRFVKKPREAVDIFSENIQKWWNEFGKFVHWVD